MKCESFILILAVLLVVIFLFGDTEPKYNPSSNYCEMWEIWHDSQGEYGWPDTDNRYEKECDVKK